MSGAVRVSVPANRLVYTVEMAAHCGRLAAATRCLLAAAPGESRDVVELLAQAALDEFDRWSLDWASPPGGAS